MSYPQSFPQSAELDYGAVGSILNLYQATAGYEPHNTYHDEGKLDADCGGRQVPREDQAHALQSWLLHRRESLSAGYECNYSRSGEKK